MFEDPDHYDSIHGIGHLARVAIMGKVLAQLEGLSPREADLVFLAGAFHDTARRDDNQRDNGHGERARLEIAQKLRFLDFANVHPISAKKALA